MSVGSSFDAYAKSYLFNALFGQADPKYEFTNIFEAQVEPHNRDWARIHGKVVFDKYKNSGALADLMLELSKSIEEPRFEFDVRGVVNGYREGVTKTSMGVPLLGKPDVKFINAEGAHVIYDFKVNGYCSSHNTSPKAGYIQLREESGFRKGCHKNALLINYKGLEINGMYSLEVSAADWALQLSTYGWLMGSSVGDEIIVGVDQIVGNETLRFATHRTRVSEAFQFEAISNYQDLWSIVTGDPIYFFRDLSFEDSATKCKQLDTMFAAGTAEVGSEEEWIKNMARQAL